MYEYLQGIQDNWPETSFQCTKIQAYHICKFITMQYMLYKYWVSLIGLRKRYSTLRPFYMIIIYLSKLQATNFAVLLKGLNGSTIRTNNFCYIIAMQQMILSRVMTKPASVYVFTTRCLN